MTDFNTYYKEVLSKDKDGKYFERKFVPWFLENDPVWKTIVKKVWLFEDYPHKKKCRWQRADEGTDIVMEDVDGNTWAIQCKNWNPEKTVIRHGDYDSFITDSENECVDKRLFITTQKKISKTIQNDINKKRNIRPVHVILYNDFVESALDYPEKKSDLIKPYRRKLIVPFPYQTQLLNKLIPRLKKSERGQLIMACGTGKSYMGVWSKEKLKAKKTLILVPTLMLISDTFKNWLTTSKKIPRILCVCSDPSVTQNKMKDIKYDALLESLDDVPFPVENDISKIKTFMNCEDDSLIISTYDSSHLITKAQKSINHEFDLIIFDEAHNCVGLKDSKFNEALDNNNIKSQKRLFMTATQKIFSNKLRQYIKKKEETDEITPVVDMSDEAYFGPTCAEYSFSQAIKDKNLSDYKVVVVGVTDEELKNNISKRELVKIKSLISSSKYIKHDMEYISILSALHKSIKKYNIRRLISFHSRQKWSRDFSKYIKDYNELINGKIRFNTNHIQGDIPTRLRLERLSILKDFEDYDCSIVSNARCLTEGINVPNLDAIAFIDPKQSPVDIVQAIGRAIRKSDSKKFGIIFLPLFINLGDFKKYKKSKMDLSNFIKECPGYENTINLVQALKSHDERLVLQLNELRTKKGEKPKSANGGKSLTNFVFDLPTTISLDFTESLVTNLIDATTSSWYEMYGELKNFKNAHGHCNPPRSLSGEKFNLGMWVSHQRSKRNGSRQPALTQKQIGLLDELDFIWDVADHEFDRGCEEYVSYISKHNSHGMNKNYITETGFSLGSWVSNLREKHYGITENNFNEKRLGNEKKTTFSAYKESIQEEYERLVAINFVFDAREQRWMDKFYELEAFKIKYNHLDVPKTKNYNSLRIWLDRQRSYMRKYENSDVPIDDNEELKYKFNRSRYDKLVNLGCNAIVKKVDRSWDEWIRILKMIYRKFNTLKITKNQREELNLPDVKRWLFSQTEKFNKNKLSEAKQKVLTDLGHIFNEHESQWMSMYNDLVVFEKHHKHTRVAFSNGGLGGWVSTQRELKRKNKLSKDRIDLLNKIGFDWDPLNNSWLSMYNELIEFKKENKHTRVSFSSGGLGGWVSTQRRLKKKNKLSKDRIDLLNKIDFEWKLNNEV